MNFLFSLILLICIGVSLNSNTGFAQIKINESFDGPGFPPEGWSSYSSGATDGQWNRSVRTTKLGSGCAVSNFSSSASLNYLITKSIIPSTGDSLVFYFRQTFWNVYRDTLKVKISNTDSLASSMNTTLLTMYEGLNYLNPNIYSRVAVSLNSYSGQKVWIGFVHSNLDGENIRIDEVKIGNDVPGEVGITDNIFPKGLWGNCTLEGFVPKATLRNNSSSSINTPFNITYKITGPVSFTSTKTDTISGNHTKIIYFDSLNNINIPGVYNVKIYSCLESDMNRSNDTLTSTFTLSPSNYGGGATSNGNYYFANSSDCSDNAPSNPQFNWRDTTLSTNLILNGNLKSAGNFTGDIDNGYFSLGNILPSDKKIKFFNIEYDSVFITTNGIIAFKRNGILTSNDPSQVFLLMIQPVPAIASFWIDLDFQNTDVTGNRLSYKVTENQMIITYDKAPLKSGGPDDYVSFQISLEVGNSLTANSDIVIQFNQDRTGNSFLNKYYSNSLPAHLIGMKNISGTNSLTYRYKDNSNVTTGGSIFNSSLALQIGQYENELNSRASDFNFKVLLEAVYPRSDTVKVSLADIHNPGLKIETKNVYIHPDGTGTCKFTLPDDRSTYYIIIEHRNSVKIWSKLNGETSSSNSVNYDFSLDSTMAFGNNLKMINSKAYFYSGDVNQDGTIDCSDLSFTDNFAFTSTTGYLTSDLNNDGITDIEDISFVENNIGLNVHLMSPEETD
ncbi:MAG: choice-of-anchor J domain-containing protein [Ignavibacteria bacterium]|nr:choice-of-anchor J domain-containing protein [Ignavibacteria bacterium]